MNINKRIIAFVLAGIFAISMVVPAANAATLEEQIASLSAMIVALQAEIAGQTAGATVVCFDADLQQGMTSDSVKDLQIKLGVTPTSGYFGPITLAAVKTFQTSNGIINTGYVGPLTRGALNALYCTPVTPVTSFPAGCTSAVGFSSTTGLPCSGAVVTYPEGCTSAVGFSPTTGLSCAGEAVTYPEGCTSAVGFSPTTGLSCSGTIVTGPTEGYIQVSASGTFVEPTLYWNDVNKSILAFQIKAKNSDMVVNRVDLQLRGTAVLPWKVFQMISLYEGSTLVKSIVPVKSDYIENDYAKDYTLRFTGLDTTIAKDATKTFVFKTDVFETLSNVVDYTAINLPADGVRAVDSVGINQYGPSTNAIITTGAVVINDTATSAAIAASVNASSPKAGFIIGNASTVVSDQTLLILDLKATGADTTLKTLTVDVANFAYASAIKLYDGTTLLSSKASVVAPEFDNLDVAIAKDATKVLTIKADIKPITTEGYTIAAAFTAVAAKIVAIDSSENSVTSLSGGTITGKDMNLYIVAPVLSLTSATGQKTNPDTGASTYDGVIKFSVTASGGTIYVNAYNAGGAGSGILGAHTNASSTNSNYTFTSTADKVASTTTGLFYFTIPSASTKAFTVSSHATGDAKYASFALTSFYWTSVLAEAGVATTSTLDDLDWGWEDYNHDSIYLEGV